MKKKLHYVDFEQRRESQQSEFRDRNSVISSLFLKCFPKYQEESYLTSQNRAIKSRIKSAKIIKNFKASDGQKGRLDWRVLLLNKMKSVKFLNSRSQSPNQFYEKLKFFSRINSVQLFNVHFSVIPYRQIDQYAKEACKYMRRLKSLKTLEFSPKLTESKSYVVHLNSSKRLLSSLKTFKFNFDWQNLDDRTISELINGNKNLLKNITSLLLNSLHSPFHFKIFQTLGELCPRI